MMASRKLPSDWHDGTIPPNVWMAEGAYVETSYSFVHCRAEREKAIEIQRGAAAYLGTLFDVGPNGRVVLGEYAMVNGARIICDSEIIIGDYALISWNVVLMDTTRLSTNPIERRRELEASAWRPSRHFSSQAEARPIRIERNVWIGFETCVLPGVTIGEGSIVGARSVVVQDVPAFTIVAGNPAAVIRTLF
jgi:acetyltransferase-like isoleucine patch superfamily enzyme